MATVHRMSSRFRVQCGENVGQTQVANAEENHAAEALTNLVTMLPSRDCAVKLRTEKSCSTLVSSNIQKYPRMKRLQRQHRHPRSPPTNQVKDQLFISKVFLPCISVFLLGLMNCDNNKTLNATLSQI